MSRNDKKAHIQRKITQDNASVWDVIVVSFKVMFVQLQYWIKPNLWCLLLSIPLVTAPGAKAAMAFSAAAGLRDPEHSRTDMRKGMIEGFFRFFKPALSLSLLKWIIFIVIAFSFYFWITQEQLVLRIISILSLYGLVVWESANAYLYPVLVEHPQWPLGKIIKTAYSLAARNPFSTLLLCLVNFLLLILGLVLLGPILCVIPVLRMILSIHFYWYFTGQVIPGFMDVRDYYTTLQKEVIA